MTNKTKYFILGASTFLSGAIIGVMASLMLLAHPKKFFNDIGQVHLMSQFAINQYKQADYPHSKNALQQYLIYLDNYQVQKDSWLTENVIINDKIMTYARLALLEEQQGNIGLANDYWAKAEVHAAQNNWKKKDRKDIREFVQSVDKNNE